MSSCRCADISLCKQNIQRVENALKEIAYLEGPYVSISDKLDSLASSAMVAYDASNKDSFVITLKDLKCDMRDAMDSCQTALDRAIDKLRLDLSDMEEEDAQYHAEEDEDDTISTDGSAGQDGT